MRSPALQTLHELGFCFAFSFYFLGVGSLKNSPFVLSCLQRIFSEENTRFTFKRSKIQQTKIKQRKKLTTNQT